MEEEFSQKESILQKFMMWNSIQRQLKETDTSNISNFKMAILSKKKSFFVEKEISHPKLNQKLNTVHEIQQSQQS